MKSIIQFKIQKDEETGLYIAEGIDLAIITQAKSLDKLTKKIQEAISLHFEDEDLTKLGFTKEPPVLINFELPQHA